MRSYGFAIGLSISSARLVFTLAVEAQSLIHIMSKRTKAEELEPFLRGMVNHVTAGLETTELVAARFRNVRKNVASVYKIIYLMRIFNSRALLAL